MSSGCDVSPSQVCQNKADQEFLLTVIPGLLAAVGMMAYLFRPPPKGENFFQDPDTQVVFRRPSVDGLTEGRDNKV